MNNDFQRIKDAINLADYIGRYAPLKRAGTVMQCCCPLPGHNDKSPSFQVKGDGWICRGKCDAYGDIFDFVERYHGWDKQQALEELARYAGITLQPLTPEHKAQADKRERLYALMEDAVGLFEQARRASENATMYLTKTRGLSLETINAARIGYGPDQWGWLVDRLRNAGYSHREMIDAGVVSQKDKNDESTIWDRFRNRIVIPTRDSRGRVVAFTGRAMSDGQDPKYMHNATTDIFQKSSIIHRMPEFAPTRGVEGAQTVVIVEGSFDPISAANRGVLNIASLMGKECTDAQIELLCKTGAKRLVFCLDRDESGRKALRTLTLKHKAALVVKGVELYAMFAPHGKDPDDTFRGKPELWQPAVDAAQPVVKVLVGLEVDALGTNPTAMQKSTLARELLPILKSDDPFVQQENIEDLARAIHISVDNLTAWLISQSQIRVMPKAVPATQEPPLETSILWGIIFNAHDGWLQRANAALIRLSPLDKPLPYAFAPLNALDFTHAPYQDLMGKVASGLDELEQTVINTHLESVYRRVMFAPPVTSMFKADMPDEQPRETCDEFIDNVLLLRLNRLKADMVARKNFGEVMRGMALIQQKREIQIGG
jgi:DNA primase